MIKQKWHLLSFIHFKKTLHDNLFIAFKLGQTPIKNVKNCNQAVITIKKNLNYKIFWFSLYFQYIFQYISHSYTTHYHSSLSFKEPASFSLMLCAKAASYTEKRAHTMPIISFIHIARLCVIVPLSCKFCLFALGFYSSCSSQAKKKENTEFMLSQFASIIYCATIWAKKIILRKFHVSS